MNLLRMKFTKFREISYLVVIFRQFSFILRQDLIFRKYFILRKKSYASVIVHSSRGPTKTIMTVIVHFEQGTDANYYDHITSYIYSVWIPYIEISHHVRVFMDKQTDLVLSSCKQFTVPGSCFTWTDTFSESSEIMSVRNTYRFRKSTNGQILWKRRLDYTSHLQVSAGARRFVFAATSFT